jgi:hypothetical protein
VAFANGRIPASALTSVPGGQLLAGVPARSFLAFDAMCQKRYGVRAWVSEGYRSLSGQVYQRNRWCSLGRCGNAAIPGTSNHGRGMAVDAKPRTIQLLALHGRAYGWYKPWSDAPWENWHHSLGNAQAIAAATRAAGAFRSSKPIRLHERSTGTKVKQLQRLLRALGFKSVPGPGHRGYGFFGASTRSAVRRFQSKHHLGVDGVVGPTTWSRLNAAA